MTDDELIGYFDTSLRGAAVALFVLVAVLTLRQGRTTPAALLGAALSAGSAAYVLCSAPMQFVHNSVFFVPVPALCVGNGLIFWLFTRALFDDSFRPAPRHVLFWLALAAFPVLRLIGIDMGGASGERIASFALRIASPLLALLALAQTVEDWRADLVEGRRRLRLFIVIATAGYMTVIAAVELSLGVERASPMLNAVNAAGLAAMASIVAILLLRADIGLLRSERPAVAAAPEAPAPRDEVVDPGLLAELDRLMTVERIYRQEGITIGSLAARVAVSEHKIRYTINRGLGFRNFNEYLNRHRLADAREAPTDPGQAEVPILTIALDSSFRSLRPFNRAFKAETGMTPSEFRRASRTAKGA
jgi:AraC-like DNA-binding protein